MPSDGPRQRCRRADCCRGRPLRESCERARDETTQVGDSRRGGGEAGWHRPRSHGISDPLTCQTRGAWRVKGLGIVSWEHLLMLAGAQGAKAAVMIRRFVVAAAGQSRLVSRGPAESAADVAAQRLGSMQQRTLDHVNWHDRRTVRSSRPCRVFVLRDQPTRGRSRILADVRS